METKRLPEDTNGQGCPPDVPKFINNFLERYKVDFDEHLALAEEAMVICQNYIDSEALLATVTSRAKDPKSLRTKLLKRYQERPGELQSEEDIKSSIVDLSGVRIALYYPRQQSRVKSFLAGAFNIEDTIEHPKNCQRAELNTTTQVPELYSRDFSGYRATHYHASLKEAGRSKRFGPQDRVEIQVMTMLHSVWSELEHNIIYKQLNGSPSLNEHQMLDGLSGLMFLGEKYMEQFNAAFDERVKNDKSKVKSFANRYQLGSFLFSELCDSHDLRSEDFTLSSVELLRLFLQLEDVNLNTPGELSKILSSFQFKEHPRMVPLQEDNKRPNASLVMMATLYKQRDLESKATLKKAECSAQCEIMMSTILSLDEMFAPFSCWESQLTHPSALGKNEQEHLHNLKWLMHNQLPRIILSDHLNPQRGDKQLINSYIRPSEKQLINSLWCFFEKHTSEMVRFVFNISRLGVSRDLGSEISLLERIYRMFEPLHPDSEPQ